ncbi:hypothetical protein PTI98_013377 [Pleurotus ostreatus]|nr:hypothetical protein PTI98_013377 [Pleurotus ostreatus]
MMKAGGVLVGEGDDAEGGNFISCLHCKLARYNADNPSYHVPIPAILSAVRDLIAANRAHTSIPTHMVLEQIELLGQYAILSHRWEDPPEEELCFADFNDEMHIPAAAHKLALYTKIASRVSRGSEKPAVPSRVQAAEKKGFKKLAGFREVVESRWGCRYLWMDSICISEAERSESIHQMFGWYRRAYVCAVYLSTRSSESSMASITGDPWCARGWTLPELLAPPRMECFAKDWTLLSDAESNLSAFREGIVNSNPSATATPGHQHRTVYEPGVHQALSLFHAMRYRDTTRPEDRVYALFSALDIDIPVAYGEGFSRAFYRLQAECLTRGHDRRLLIWDDPHPGAHKRTRGRGSAASPHNSMLAADYKMFANERVYGYYAHSRNYGIGDLQYVPPETLPDPSISFDADGVMRIMLSLHPWPPAATTTTTTTTAPTSALTSTSSLTLTSEPDQKDNNIVFASLGMHSFTGDHYGVLLRPIPPRDPPGELLEWREDKQGNGESVHMRVIYERIQFLRCSASSISACKFREMGWVYIK